MVAAPTQCSRLAEERCHEQWQPHQRSAVGWQRDAATSSQTFAWTSALSPPNGHHCSLGSHAPAEAIIATKRRQHPSRTYPSAMKTRVQLIINVQLRNETVEQSKGIVVDIVVMYLYQKQSVVFRVCKLRSVLIIGKSNHHTERGLISTKHRTRVVLSVQRETGKSITSIGYSAD